MTCYFLAGKADDPAFARVEHIAKLIRTAYPNLFFHAEMKHPEEWKAYLASVLREYDFQGFAEDFQGPLIWTAEGHLVGGALDFVQKVYTEKLGLRMAPEVTNPMFRAMAKDNLAEVKAMKLRAKNGAPFEERCKTAAQAAEKAGLIKPPTFEITRLVHKNGVRVELRTSEALSAQREKRRREVAGGADDQGSNLSTTLVVGEIGQEHSHRLLLCPEPLGPRHMLLTPRRFGQHRKDTFELLPRFLSNEEDLGTDDFVAAAEVLLQSKERGVCFWLGQSQPGTSQPMETHLQVLPEGFQSEDDKNNGLPYPAMLQIARTLREENSGAQLPMLDGTPHVLTVPPGDLEMMETKAELGQSLNLAYEAARSKSTVKEFASAPNHGMMVAFGYNWLLCAPLRAPKQGSGFEESAYAKVPPPPACALVGVVISPSVEKAWPETAAWGGSAAVLPDGDQGAAVVESRAEVFSIPKDSAEYAEAETDIMVRWGVVEKDPLSLVKLWGGNGAALQKG